MIIRNLTSELKEIEIRELVGTSRTYKIYIEPYGKTDLDRVVVLNQEKLRGVEFVGCETPKVVAPAPVEEIVDPQLPVEPPVTEDKDEEKEETTNEEPAPVSESFICEECGAEFSSARSLSAHKSRSHNK